MRARQRLGDILYDSFFQYAVNITFGTGLDTITGTIPIQNDANFLAVHSMYETGLANAGVLLLVNGGMLVQLTDGGSNRILSNIPVPATTLFGTAQRPYMWPMTHLFKANSLIGFQVTGLAAALAGITARFVIGGFKVPVASGAAAL